MAERSGFFDAHLLNGEYDRVYLAEHFARYFANFIGNGVFAGKSSELMVRQKESADMSVRVLAGQGFINGYFYENTDELSLAIDNADGVLNRIDLIVLRWDKYERVIRIAVEKGTPASSPSAPMLKRNDDYFELELAKISIKAGATRITQVDITDTRLDSEVCGFVVSTVEHIDTAEFNAQLNAWIKEFKLDSYEEIDSLVKQLEALIESAGDLGPLIVDVENLKDFGLGGDAKQLNVVTIEDLDQTYKNGWYSFVFPNTIQVNGVNFQYGYMRVDNFDLASCTQTIYVVDEQGTILRRKKKDSTWGEFECENPPFAVDVEYRTTERRDGKAVYKKLDSDSILWYRLDGETEWKTYAQEADAVKRSGDTMTGNLTISKQTAPTFQFVEQATNSGLHIQFWNNQLLIASRPMVGDDSNYRTLLISNHKSQDDVVNALSLSDVRNGAVNLYTILHTGNLSKFGLGVVPASVE